MRFLHKNASDLEAHRELQYSRLPDRIRARDLLVNLQAGFCAYSERYLKPLDSVEVEHFDPRLKQTPGDSICNWHAVLRWMNAHKARKIERFLPLPRTDDESLRERIWYERGEFVCAPSDDESKNLIEFLGVNRPEVVKERSDHVQRVRKLRELCRSAEEFEAILSDSPEDLSFPSALEAELEVPAFELIRRTRSA